MNTGTDMHSFQPRELVVFIYIEGICLILIRDIIESDRQTYYLYLFIMSALAWPLFFVFFGSFLVKSSKLQKYNTS